MLQLSQRQSDISGASLSRVLHSATLSNLGKVELPDELSPFIDSFIFAIGTSYSSNNALTIVSYNDKLTITFSKTIAENSHEKMFFNILTENGLDLVIDSNYWEEIK